MLSRRIQSTLMRDKFSFWHFQLIGWSIFQLARIYFDLTDPSYPGYIYSGKVLHFIIYGISYDSIAFFLMLIMRYIYRIFMKRGRSLLSILLFCTLVSMFFSVLWQIFSYVADIAFGETFRFLFSEILVEKVPVLFGWSVLFFAITNWYKWKDEYNRAEKAILLAQQAQLQMLRYQLNPHFLFNSLNSIRALMDENKSASKEMITELSEFLRYSLISTKVSNVPLNKELEAIRYYLAIEKKRFENKLEITYDIEKAAEEFPVLSFLLHPLIENAIKFGTKNKTHVLKITIAAKVNRNVLTLTISNIGTLANLPDKSTIPGTGTGLQNIKLRLENAFPNGHHFHIKQVENLVVAELEIIKNDE